MPIKPLEKNSNWPIFIKLIFLGGLVVSAIIIDNVFLKKTKEIPSVLGEAQKIELQTQEKLVRKVQESSIVKDSLKKTEETSGTIIGEATNTINKLASNAGSFVSDIIYKNSIGKVVEQIDKLPKDQQEKVKEQICK
jgi:hypothetical protein